MLDQGELELFRQRVNFHDLLKDVLRNHAIHIRKQGGLHCIPVGRDGSAHRWRPDPFDERGVQPCGQRHQVRWGVPRLTVRSWNDAGRLHVAFTDNGIGIAKEHLGKVFDKLYRVPTGNVHDVKGFGLGFELRGLVMRQHGAQIDVVR